MINQQDVTQWFRTAPPEQVVQVAGKALDTIAGYPQEHRDRFSTELKSDTRSKLFDKQPA